MAPKSKVVNLELNRIGDSDIVTVIGVIDDQTVETQVWYSHLYGKHSDQCLTGDKKKIREYCEAELLAKYQRDQATNPLITKLDL